MYQPYYHNNRGQMHLPIVGLISQVLICCCCSNFLITSPTVKCGIFGNNIFLWYHNRLPSLRHLLSLVLFEPKSKIIEEGVSKVWNHTVA